MFIDRNKGALIMKTRAKEGFKFLSYGLEAFAVIGIELLLAYVIEANIYHKGFNEYSTGQSILHWVITCICWGVGAFLVIMDCKKHSDLDLIADIKKPGLFNSNIKVWQWILIVLGVTACLVSTWIDWNGSKVLREWNNRGPLLFTFQYIYYLFEVLLVLLIIIFGQTAFEKWFNNNKIPFGGILLALTWGIGHWFTKGSLATGIYTAVGGFVFGSVYVLTNRNVKLSYILLCIMFIL